MHANRGGTNKSPNKLNAVEIQLTQWFVDKWGKPFARQNPIDEFKVTTPENPLINNQTITSIRNLTITLAYPKILTYSWTFISILNWTWSCSSLLSFDAQISNLWLTLCTNPSMWLFLATLNDVIDSKVLHFINNEDQKVLGYKTLRCTNAVASHRVYMF